MCVSFSGMLELLIEAAWKEGVGLRRPSSVSWFGERLLPLRGRGVAIVNEDNGDAWVILRLIFGDVKEVRAIATTTFERWKPSQPSFRPNYLFPPQSLVVGHFVPVISFCSLTTSVSFSSFDAATPHLALTFKSCPCISALRWHSRFSDLI